MTNPKKSTPTRSALRPNSSLLPLVKDGLGALEAKHRALFDERIRASFADSLDIDEGLRKGRDNQNRWDYLLGQGSTGKIFAVEPHSAKSDEVDTVIRKRMAALEQLRPHLREGSRISKWIWVTEGKVHFPDTASIRLKLSMKGISFVGRAILPRDLES